jgi:hypothetical protein
MMDESDKAWIKQLIHDSVREAMQAERQLVEVAIESHARSDDHIAFKAFMLDVQRKREMWDKLKVSVLGAVIIGALFWVGSHAIDIAAWMVKNWGQQSE